MHVKLGNVLGCLVTLHGRQAAGEGFELFKEVILSYFKNESYFESVK